jgi:single stranded DNA-binding protein
MSLSLNKVILAGTLADKPVVREIEGGQKMVGLSIVTEHHWCDAKSGKKQQSQEWHRIVIIHEPLAAFAEANLSRDDDVYLEGELFTERWLSRTFESRTLTKIILWQEAHQLRRLTGHDQEPRASFACRHPLLDAAREAHLIEIPSDNVPLGHVA